jgi:hypothetical protein
MREMNKQVRGVLWLICALFLAYDLYLWGGLAVTPVIGQQLRDNSTPQSPLAASYLFLGRHAVNASGLARSAADFAAEKFPAEIADRESVPQLIVGRFVSAQSGTATLNYYGAPILLLLSLALHATRQKPIRSFGVKQ